MTQEEKAKAYDEAVEIISDYYQKIKYSSISNDTTDREVLERAFPQLKENSDEKIRNRIIALVNAHGQGMYKDKMLAWLEKQGENITTLPKWKYKKDNTPLLRDSLILNKYGCVAKSPSGALVSDVWVIDYDELAKLPKEESEKQGEQKPVDNKMPCNPDKCIYVQKYREKQKPAWSEEDNQYLCGLIGLIEQSKAGLPITLKGKAADNCIDWLKSLHPQKQWKPSEKQLYSLERVLHYYGDVNPVATEVRKLLEQLKKL